MSNIALVLSQDLGHCSINDNKYLIDKVSRILMLQGGYQIKICVALVENNGIISQVK